MQHSRGGMATRIVEERSRNLPFPLTPWQIPTPFFNIAEVVWQRGLLKKGVGICHGVSGNGYYFLYLHRYTRDPKHLHRALQFAEFAVSPKCRTEAWPETSKPYSLFNGLSGAVCYFGDLLPGTQFCFPGGDL